MRARDKGRGGLLFGRFYFSKWLTLPVLGHKKVLVLTTKPVNGNEKKRKYSEIETYRLVT